MNKKFSLPPSEIELFQEMIKGTKKLAQDKILHSPKRKKVTHYAVERLQQEQVDASYYFSDEFQPNLATEGPMRYLREGANAYELKKLRRGDYVPEFFLDLHGLTQLIAKQEIGALIAACRR